MATAKALSDVDDLLTCSVCIEVLTDPYTLQQCLHNFCKKCAGALKREHQDAKLGVLCPVCRTFSSNEEIKSNFFISDLLEKHATLQSRIKPLCKQCKLNIDATQRCVECKMYLCDPCKDIHLSIPMLQGHEIVPFDGIEDIVIDKLVFCEVHKDKTIEFNCKQCEVLLCIKCKIIDHENHSTETVEMALERLLPNLKENRKKVDENVGKLREQISDVDDRIKKVKDEFATCRQEVKKNADDIIDKVRQSEKLLQDELSEKEAVELKKLQAVRDSLHSREVASKNLSGLVDTSLQKARHTSQLAELQRGLYKRVKQHSGPTEGMVDVHIKVPVLRKNNELEKVVSQKKVLGCVEFKKENINQDKGFPFRSKIFDGDFNMMLSKPFKRVKEVQLPGRAYHMSIIKNNNWVCLCDKKIIQIYNDVGRMVNTLTFQDHSPIAVEQFSGSSVVMACEEKGLYEVSMDGKILQTIATGKFCDVCVDGSQVFALEYEKKQVQVFSCFVKNNVNVFNVSNTIAVEKFCDIKNNGATLCVDNMHIYISGDKMPVCKITKAGRFVCNMGNEKILYPAIGGIDRNGSLIIANYHGKCVEVLSSDGVCETQQLEKLGYVDGVLVSNYQEIWILGRELTNVNKYLARYKIP